jgi:long-chain acyl-CoA synthetase
VPIGPKRPGESAIYRNPESVSGLLKLPADIQNMQNLWLRSVRQFGKNKCLEDLTYEQVDEMTKYLGSWLADNGFKVVYIHSVNRVEWALMDIACLKYGIPTVALYDTLGKEALDYTLKLTGGKCTAESKNGVTALMKARPDALKGITHMILFDEIDAVLTKDVASYGIKLFQIRDIINRKIVRPYPKISPDVPFSYCFTSGTTGQPKGVITTHLNMVSQLFSVQGMLAAG